jgi:hypothetical protein
MHLARVAPWVLSAACLLGACAETADLVIIPAGVETATIPEAMTKNAHAVYYYDIGQVHFDPIDIDFTRGRFYAFTRYVKVKLLTRAATEGGMFGNVFLRHMGDLVAIQAYVEKPDGTRTELKAGDFVKTVLVKDAVPDSNQPIDFVETTIIFPGLEPGDVIGYQYTQRGYPSTWQFNHVSAPVLYSRFMMARPPFRVEIQPVIVNRHGLDIEQSKETGMATGLSGRVGVSQQAVFDVWTVKNVPAIQFEEGMPAAIDLSSYVGVWWFGRRYDWATLGEVYHGWFNHYGRPPSKVKEATDKVIQGIADPRARAKAIHDWVKVNLNILDYNQLTPVPREVEIDTVDIAKLLTEKNATPEEAANLTYLMLQSAGVDASLVLTSDEESAPVLEEIPSRGQFTHVLLAMPDGTWVDTTSRVCSFGALPWGFEGRKALWVKSGTAAFRDIPVSAPADNLRKVVVRGELSSEGQAKVEAKLELSGHMALAFRRLLVPMKPKEREDTLRSLVTASADGAELEGFELRGLDDVDRPLQIDLGYRVPRYAEVLRDKLLSKAGAFVHLLGCPILSRASGASLYVCPRAVTEGRVNPLRFPFKRLDEYDIQVALPAGFHLQAIPKGFRTRDLDKGTAVGMQTSYGLSDDQRTLLVPRKLSVNETFIDLEAYANLRAMLGRFQAQKDTLLTLELPKMD